MSTLLTVPEGMLVRIISEDLSASMIMALRYTMAAILGLPFVIGAIRKRQITLRRTLFLMLLAVPLVVDPFTWKYVVATTNASYASILALAAPVVFVIISTVITKDALSRNKVIGFLLAVLGGILMVLLPNLNGDAMLNFGAVPVLLMFAHAITVAIATIIWRKENEKGVPILAVMGSFYIVWAIISSIVVFVKGDAHQIQNVTASGWLIILYLGAIASILMNAVFTKYYVNIGTTAAATMKYFKRFLSVVLPILILGEVLSWEIALGAAFIVAGVIFANKKPSPRKTSYVRNSNS